MNPSDLDQHLIDLETELLGAGTRANAERLNELLADDFVEFGASGRIWDKPSVIAGLLSEPAAPASSLTATDFAVRHLSGDFRPRHLCSVLAGRNRPAPHAALLDLAPPRRQMADGVPSRYGALLILRRGPRPSRLAPLASQDEVKR